MPKPTLPAPAVTTEVGVDVAVAVVEAIAVLVMDVGTPVALLEGRMLYVPF